MKKLLILTLVLGMASVANATLQISVDGDKEPVDTEIYLTPSQTIELGVWTTTKIQTIAEQFAGWALVCQVLDGTISGGVSLWLTEPGIAIYDGAAGVGFPMALGEDGVWGGIALTTIPEIPAGGVIYDEIVFHCEWQPNDVVINLYSTADWVTSNLEDSVIIHQIPEPATMLLLGLGGLFLRRRK